MGIKLEETAGAGGEELSEDIMKVMRRTFATDEDGLFPTHIPVLNTEEPTREFVGLLKDILSFIHKKMVTISLFQMMSMHLMKMVLSLWRKVTRSFLVVVS